MSEERSETTQPPLPQPIIQLENVSVSYRLPSERIGTFKEYAIRKLQRKIKIEKFWALKDISLEVNQGEVFGLAVEQTNPRPGDSSTLENIAP